MEPEPYYATGGIIKAKFATFRNNRIDVKIYPYRDGIEPNNCWFSGCNLETTKSLLEDANPFYHLMVSGVNEIQVKGCTFINRRDEIVSYISRGSGVYSYNSQMNLQRLDTLVIINGIEIPINRDDTLSGMNFGFHGICGGIGTAAMKMNDAEISDNVKGVYLSGYSEISPIDLEVNTFSMTRSFNAQESYGLYLDNCSGFKVTKNSFDGSSFSGSEPLIGIIVNNSGAKTNYLYNNFHFTDLACGILAQNINRGYYTPDNGGPSPWPIETGLRFVCNDFNQCFNDMVINENSTSIYNGITYYQRNIEDPPNETQKPAGNSFSLMNQGASHVWDIDIDADVGNIQYMHHTSPPNGPSLRLFPDQVSNPEKVTYYPFAVEGYNKEISCPDNFYPSGGYLELRSAINLADQKIDSLVNLLQLLTDDGSTDTLRNTVENSTPPQSYDVYQDLMSASPYLSDTVLKASIINESVLPNAMIRDIMVVNPQSAKSEDLLNTLDNRINPMPDSLWAEILQGQDTIGAMERLKSELSGWIQKRDIYFNNLIELFLKDTIYSADSLTGLLQNDFNLISRYNLITYYLDHHNFNQANDVLQSIPNQFTLSNEDQVVCQDFTTLIPILEQLCNDTFGYIVPDSIQINILLDLATHDRTTPGTFARNILIANGLLEYHEPILLGTTLKSLRPFHNYGKNVQISSEFKVYPNPCKDYLIVECQKAKLTDIVICNLINSARVILSTYSLQKSSNQVIIPLTTYPPGNYFVQLKVNGINKGICQVIKIN